MMSQHPRKPKPTPAPTAAPRLTEETAQNRRRPRRILTWARACIFAVLTSVHPISAAESTSPPTSLRDLPDTVNVHHQTRYCHLCHETGPNGPIASKVHLGNNYRAGCACHYNTPGDLRHPTDVAVPDEMRPKLADLFPLTDGKMTCISCHSFEVLCAAEKPRTSSLRGAPYLDRTTFCFRCHDEAQYQPLNPHQQLNDAGKMVPETCLFCHAKKPNEATASYSSVKLIGDSEMLCKGCHNVGHLHPAGKPHLVKPDLDYRFRMRQIEIRHGIVLPLDNEGKITCVTCHNPHQAGVIPKTRPGAKGAGEELRQRLTGILCAECHFPSTTPPNR